MSESWFGGSRLRRAAGAAAILIAGNVAGAVTPAKPVVAKPAASKMVNPVKPGAVKPVTPVAAAAPKADGSLFSEIQVTRGAEVLGAHCAVCHGAELRGGGGSPPLQGPDFMFGWSNKTTKDLVELISAKMPPGQAHSLSNQEYEDVTAYILSANGFRAGSTPLSPVNPQPIGQPPEAAK